MPELTYAQAIERALAQAMADDERIVILGEDVHLLRQGLAARFGRERVLPAPISEAAFLTAGVGAAMAGLRPVVEIMMVDFIGVAFDALLNHAAKLEGFSGGRWQAPLVVRAACGGWYGDGGQHEQALWGMLGGIPGLTVLAPSTPADAAGLMLAALRADGPVVFLEHKLLSDYWLDYLGAGGRKNVSFDVPAAGARGWVDEPIAPLAFGLAARRRQGKDVSILSLGVGAHRAMQAAEELASQGIDAGVIDLRCVAPLDRGAIVEAAASGRVLVVDEDYVRGGLSGEIAAVLAEERTGAAFARVAVTDTLPYARHLEEDALPNVRRIVEAAERMVSDRARTGTTGNVRPRPQGKLAPRSTVLPRE